MNNNFQIFSDSACDLTSNILPEKYIIPFYVSLDSNTYYKDKVEISATDFYSKIDGVYPKTSVPSVQDYIDKFKPVLESGEDVICITISGELSSSVQSAKNAATILAKEYPKRKIFIKDSRLATVPQGLIVRQMLEMRENGYNVDKVFKYLENAVPNSGVNFLVGDVSYLQKGGRIGSVVLRSAKALNLKPIVCLSDGKITSRGVARGEVSALEKIKENTIEHFKDINPKNYIFAVGYTNDTSQQTALNLEKEMASIFKDCQFLPPFQIGATIGAHTGNSTFGIGFVKKYR